MTKKTKKKDEERDYQRLVEQETLIFEATELLSELIEESGENRKELADKLGRSKGFVTQILAGDRNMTLRTLADFAFALEHRVKVAAAPLVESGNGGEAIGGQGRAMARIYAGAGEFLAQRECEKVGDDPRRPLAAEGAGLIVSGSYAVASYFSNQVMREKVELPWSEVHAPDEIETVAA